MFGDLGGDFYKNTYEPKLFGMHIGSVLSGLEAGNVNNDHKMPNQDCERIGGVKNDVFPKFGDLEGDFYKETHEAKLFGMHIGSVLSGLDAGNVNTDAKMSIVEVGNVYEQRGRKRRFFDVWRPWRGLL